MPRTYVDNAYNRRHGRVGLPIGSAVISKNTICGVNTKTYVDNAYNRSIGRVGMPHGSAVMSKYDGLTTWHYLDTDRDMVLHPPSVQPKYEPEFVVKPKCEPEFDVKPKYEPEFGVKPKYEPEFGVKPKYEPEFRETNHTEKLLRPRNIPNTRTESVALATCYDTSTRKERTAMQSAEAMKRVNEAAFRADLAQMETERKAIQKSQSEQQDVRLKYTACMICYNDIEDASVTPCGHHFCTHCIIQLLETKRKCPRCHKHVRESDVFRDEEFDAVVLELQNTKSENKALVQQVAMYERQCEELKQELYEIKENVLVEQTDLVRKLRGQLREQEEILESNALSKNGLRAVKNLQYFYERQIRGKKTFTENTIHQLHMYTDVVLDEVCAKIDTRDDLLSIIRGYTWLIVENSELHRNASKLENQLRNVKRDLHLAKAKTHKLERKYHQERTLDED